MDVKINRDNSEIISYDKAGIPIYIREGYLSFYPAHRARCHWHEDIEFIYIIDGAMDYYINGRTVRLEKGDSVMINSGHLHYGYSLCGEECHFYCIIFHPSLISSNSLLQEHYVKSITSGSTLEYLLFREGEEQVSDLLKEIVSLKSAAGDSYDLEVLRLFLALWIKVYQKSCLYQTASPAGTDHDLDAQKQMVAYIYQNHASPIVLEDIARSGNMSRSKCCRIFKKYLQQSPIDFLNNYRLECSCYLLSTTDMSITQISTDCGFNHLSYFAKLFQNKYGCTPRDYRRRTSHPDAALPLKADPSEDPTVSL